MAQKKYTDGSGVSEIWLNIKNYIASQLLGYSQTGHTHTKSQITDLDLNNYLPLRGGTLSGSISFSGSCYTSVGTGKQLSSDRYVVTTTRGSNSGGALYLYGGDFENSWGEKGNFRLVAQSKEKGSKYLLGTPSGSLTWNGKELATQEYVNTNYSQTGHTHSASDITSGLATVATSGSYNDLSNKPTIPKVNNATLTIQKNGTTVDTFTANSSTDKTVDITVPTKTSDLTNDSGFITEDNTKIPLAGSNQISGSLIPATDNSIDIGSSTKNIKTLYTKGITINGTQFLPSDYIPRSGGAVMTSSSLGRNVNNDQLRYHGGTSWNMGATLSLYGKDNASYRGRALLHPSDGTNSKNMWLYPDGTWTWDGTACQITSDRRLKQQIAEIDDKLLDAWEDVELSQFKYNDAVNEKGDKARLHTGFVVQQIDSACKSHNVDISAYGLYCHEEYPQETEEIEVEQADGTKVKETKVIREASEHYSLRYTEVYAVECMYLRRCIARLTARIEELEKGNNTK